MINLLELNLSCWLLCLDLGLKLLTVDRAFAKKHYADLSAKPFFNGLVEYIVSGPVVAMVWAGKGVVTAGRKIIGATNPLESAAGTIRSDYAIDIGSTCPEADLGFGGSGCQAGRFD
nr:nucleoside diphosphate kinase-like [Nicotiana tomentosiformis]